MGTAAVLNDSGWMTFKNSSTILPYRPVPGLSLRAWCEPDKSFIQWKKGGGTKKMRSKRKRYNRDMIRGLTASRAVLSTGPAKMFFSSKFSYLFFATPSMELKLWQKIGGGLLIANQLDQSLWWYQSKSLSRTQIIFVTLFPTGSEHCWAFYPPPQRVK